jgi:hypothetical protein
MKRDILPAKNHRSFVYKKNKLQPDTMNKGNERNASEFPVCISFFISIKSGNNTEWHK